MTTNAEEVSIVTMLVYEWHSLPPMAKSNDHNTGLKCSIKIISVSDLIKH